MTQGSLDLDPPSPDVSTGQEKPLKWLCCARPGCQFPVPPQKRGGERKRYCSEDCQQAHYRETHVAVPVQNPDKQTRAEKVLERLKQGRCTGLDLLKAGGGTCYRDQIRLLRRQGHYIVGSRPWTRWVEGPQLGVFEPEEVPALLPKTPEGWDQYELREK